MKMFEKVCIVLIIIAIAVIGCWKMNELKNDLNKSNNKIEVLENKVIKLEEEIINKKESEVEIINKKESEVEINNNEIIDETEKDNNSTDDKTENENMQESNNSIEIIKKIKPSGWSGASNKEVQLYSNGDVYCIVYNGEGYTENDIIEKELIAQNATDIEGEGEGPATETIVVKGKNIEIINNENTWIVFD